MISVTAPSTVREVVFAHFVGGPVFGTGDVNAYVVQLTAVPEPATFTLLLLWLLPILLARRRPARRLIAVHSGNLPCPDGNHIGFFGTGTNEKDWITTSWG